MVLFLRRSISYNGNEENFTNEVVTQKKAPFRMLKIFVDSNDGDKE